MKDLANNKLPTCTHQSIHSENLVQADKAQNESYNTFFVKEEQKKKSIYLTRFIDVTGLLSKCNHSILGGGLPLATQST